MLDVGHRGCLHVQNGNARTVLGNAGAQIPQGLDLADRAESVGKGGNERLRYPRIALEEYHIKRLHYFPSASTARHGNRAVQRCTGVNADTDVNTDERCSNRCGLTTSFPPRSRSRAQTTQPGASRSASAGFPLCPRPAPVPSGKWLKAACLPQKASQTFPRVLLPFQAPARSSPDAGGNLQILPTGFVLLGPILIHFGVECVQWKVHFQEDLTNPIPKWDGTFPTLPERPPPSYTGHWAR